MSKPRCSALTGAVLLGLSLAPAAVAQVTRDTAQATAPRTTGALHGRVIDPGTGEYLRSAMIRADTTAGRRSVLSGDRGEYRIANVPAGPVQLTVQFTGYTSAQVSLEVEPGETRLQDIELHSTASAAGPAGWTVESVSSQPASASGVTIAPPLRRARR